jgi:hypothetical protein
MRLRLHASLRYTIMGGSRSFRSLRIALLISEVQSEKSLKKLRSALTSSDQKSKILIQQSSIASNLCRQVAG